MPDLGDAHAAHERAGELIQDRLFREAVEPAAEACRLRPDWPEAWWNYGVALKHTHRWAECLTACDRAIALAPDDSEGPRWNAGIAATALGDWQRARDAWSAYGIAIPAGTGPLEMDLGPVGIRLSTDSGGEVVFAQRLDPCRARIISVPLAESQHRFSDLVLHDGESRGKRRVGDAQVPVFDELALLEPSAYGTWQVTARCDTPEHRDALLALYADGDEAIEDWTESITLLCETCSLGDRCEDHARRDTAWSVERRFGLALRDSRGLGRLRRLGWWWRRGIRDVHRVL